MAQIILNIPDKKLDLVVDALNSNFPGRSSETKVVWAKKQVIDFLKKQIRVYESRQVQENIVHNDVEIS